MDIRSKKVKPKMIKVLVKRKITQRSTFTILEQAKFSSKGYSKYKPQILIGTLNFKVKNSVHLENDKRKIEKQLSTIYVSNMYI